MTSLARHRTPLLLTVTVLLLPLLAVLLQTQPSSSAPPRASLTVSPGTYIGGQRVVFEGNIGRTGRHKLRLQFNLARPGDPWNTIQGFRARSKPNGDFRFGYRAPSMFGKLMRVSSKGGLRTPPVKLYAMTQDVVVDAPERVARGQQFRISVDTTPNSGGDRDLRGTGGHLPPPALPGRTLTLERRIDTGVPFGYAYQWESIGTTTAGDNGNGVFDGLTAQSDTVYRVRQERWTKDGDDVGWYPSFPVQVRVDGSVGAAPARATATADVPPPASRGTAAGKVAVGSKTAAERFRWRPALWGFAWGYGESFDTRPASGTDRVGRWLDASTGTGRAAKHNGGLMLDSQRQNHDDDEYDDSYGTTSATMRDNPMKYGRWEVRLRTKSSERDDADARVRIELVPEDPADYACGARTITVADVSPHVRSVRIGARNGDRQWARRVDGIRTNNVSGAFGVEVSKRHITWFYEGRPIGTLKSRAAVSDVPMTLRLSIVGGDESQELDRTQAIFDWMRGYGLAQGRQVRSGGRLTSSAAPGGC